MIADRTAATVAIHDVCGPGVATTCRKWLSVITCHFDAWGVWTDGLLLVRQSLQSIATAPTSA